MTRQRCDLCLRLEATAEERKHWGSCEACARCKAVQGYCLGGIWCSPLTPREAYDLGKAEALSPKGDSMTDSELASALKHLIAHKVDGRPLADVAQWARRARGLRKHVRRLRARADRAERKAAAVTERWVAWHVRLHDFEVACKRYLDGERT